MGAFSLIVVINLLNRLAMSSLWQQMERLKASQLRAVSTSNSDDSLSRKRARPEQSTNEARLKMKKAKAKQESVIRQMSASVNSSVPSNTAAKKAADSRNVNANFKALGKVVDLMRDRHKDNINYPMTFAEIQDALLEKHGTSFYIPPREMTWLKTEALPNNPKINMDDQNRFTYKPPYSISGRKNVIKLLKNHDLHGEGGILVDDIEESLPREKAKNTIAQVKENPAVTSIQRSDKKQVLFLNDTSLDIDVDEDIQKLWNSVQVSGIELSKIEEYLQKHDIQSMQDTGGSKSFAKNPKKKAAAAPKKRMWNQKVHNTHMGDVLQDYSDRAGPGAQKFEK